MTTIHDELQSAAQRALADKRRRHHRWYAYAGLILLALIQGSVPIVYAVVTGRYQDRHWWPPTWDDVTLTVVVMAAVFLTAWYVAGRRRRRSYRSTIIR